MTTTSSEAVCQVVWPGRLHGDRMDQDREQVVLNVDNKSTTFVGEDRVRHERSKHIDAMYRYIKDGVQEGKT